MRLPGGVWDKLGNRYESLWTVEALLSVLRGETASVTVEQHGPEGEGVEFHQEFADGSREYFSAKRQTTGNVWSLAVLTKPSENGRSILGDLFNRLGDTASKHRAVFASQTTANTLLRLCEEASRAGSSKAFEDAVRGSIDLANECDEYVLSRLNVDWSGAWDRLRRLRVDGCTEDFLRRTVERTVERDLVRSDNAPFSPAAARLVMYELVYESFGKAISRDDIVAHLAKEQFASRDWTRPTPDHDNLERRNRLYTDGVEGELIENTPIPRKEVDTIVEALNSATSSVVLAGAAGMGKSCVLAQCLRALEQRGISYLALRLDAQSDAASAAAFGRELSFSISPVAVLSGVARGRPAVLVIDQLDALSTASGRNPRLWDLFQELLFEAKHFGRIRLLLACRVYDLESDDRLRTLADRKGGALRVNLEPLPVETVREVLKRAEAPVEKFNPRHLELLRTPLHLSVFLQGDPQSSQPANDLAQLYDRYWRRKCDDARARRSGPVRFEETVQRLADWLSTHQTLTAPRDIFGDLDSDAQALASDHVLALTEKSCRFFHETFFDYIFARGFIASGKRLLPDLLPQGEEQHLFRRSQVRQVLAYQRGRDGGFSQYLSDLHDLLTTERVRVHLKKAMVDWLSNLSDPTCEEWQVVTEVQDSRVSQFARFVPWNRPAWFPVLRDSGTLASWLANGDAATVDFTIRLLGLPETMTVHSAGIATSITSHLRDTPEWRQRFAGLCYFGEIYHSREFFDLFLDKFREGWFDQQLATDWFGLSKLAKGNPAYASEFLAEFLRKCFPSCTNDVDDLNAVSTRIKLDTHFFKALPTNEPLPVLTHVLPVLAEVLKTSSRTDEETETRDPLLFCRNLGDPFRFGDALVQYLVNASRALAQHTPTDLDVLTSALVLLPNDSVAFLLEHAWAANGAYFADKAANYLSIKQSRLNIRYSEGGYGPAVTRKLLQAIGPHVSNDALLELLSAILAYRNDWECRNPKWSGHTEYALLLALPETRLGKEAWHRLDELRRKFGPMELAEPVATEAGFVPSPISFQVALKMSDRQWLQAIRKYSADRIYGGYRNMLGGSIELARVLETVAQCDKKRFARFLLSLPIDIAHTYFDHLLSGICKTTVDNELKDKLPAGAFEPLGTETIEECVARLHGLPGTPCGKQICWSVRSVSDRKLSDSLLAVVAHYAQNDPDPESEDWQTRTSSGTPMYGGNAHSYGINSVRGAASETIMRFLFDDRLRWSVLEPAVLSLVHDRSLAVRSCAVGCLLARMNENREQAVSLFMELIEGADPILDTYYMDRFLHYAAFSHFSVIHPLLQRMLTLANETKEVAARQIAVAAFHNDAAREDLEKRVLTGDEVCRAAAAGVFAHNFRNPEVADTCRERLRTLFQDSSEKVHQQTDQCWRELTAEQLVAERELISKFINSPALAQGVGGLLDALEHCPERLPEEVLLIPERLLEEQRRRAQSGYSRLDLYFHESSKLVMSLYQQSRAHRRDAAAAAFDTRCLDVIDAMLSGDLGAMDSELRKLDQ